jgi:hypothetical protein
MMNMRRMNEIVKDIRANGSATVKMGDKAIEIGFANSGHAELTMLGGGYYTIRDLNGDRYEIAKGQLIMTV